MSLKRSISPFALLMMSVGGIVGSGWLLGPLYTAQIAGPAGMLSWVIGGLLMMVIALTFAELGTMFPITGGMVRFIQFSHGTLVSFVMGWITWLAAVVVAPIETLAIIQYASNYIPQFMHHAGTGYVISVWGIFAAAIVMLVMCFLNKIGAKLVSKTNVGIVLFKLAIPVGTLIILLTMSFHGSNFTAFGGFVPTGMQGILSALPAAGVIFSFIGYSPAIQLAGEARNPQRAIPLAIIGSLACCIILYVLLQLAFVGSLQPRFLTNGWQHLAFSGDAGPFAGIMMALGLGWVVTILYADAAISPFGTAFIYTTATARINYAMSQNGYMPKFFLKLNKNGVPMKAIMVNFLIGMIIFLPFPGWQSMVSFLVSCFVLVYAVGPIALVSLRRAIPNHKRTFRLPCATFISLAAFYICNLIVFWTGWDIVSKLLIAIGIGIIYLVIYKQTATGKQLKLDYKQAWWLIPYLIGTGIISYLGSFGGGCNIIPFGIDFIVIAIF